MALAEGSEHATADDRPPASIILTAAHEERTLNYALDALMPQVSGRDEVLVICPDDATASVAQARAAAGTGSTRLRVLRDAGRGKPAALNLAIAAAQHDVLVLTDGDVAVGPGALTALLALLREPRVGAASGHPLPVDSRASLFGYWAHLLTDAGAHARRLERDRQGAFLECSGYLYAVRRSLLDPIPENALAEDGIISRMIWDHGGQIRYVPTAVVFVKYPSTYSDWLRQKVRSAGGYAQQYAVRGTPPGGVRRRARPAPRARSFREEVRAGTSRALAYPRTMRERWWTLLLFAARLHVWLLILWRVRIARLPLAVLWKRVETTK
ncbi:MAG: hypothetical protein NVSMB65_08390 [Chloroflexota bacterium]